MASITIEIPMSPDYIPDTLRRLRDELQAATAQAEAIRGAILAVQNMCSHPTKTHGRDYDGSGWTRCTICEKAW
jgi:hypothetical protein